MVSAWESQNNLVLGQVQILTLGMEELKLENAVLSLNFNLLTILVIIWNKLNQIIKIESIRAFKNSDKEVEKTTRYYISSLQDNAGNYQQNIRSHWGIENKLHWTLDVAFSEDASRKRNKNAAQNYSILLKMTLNLLKNEKSEKQGIAGKRLKADWNEKYLLKVLNIKV